MSFITFLLIVGLYHGGKDEFDADNFQYVFSKSLFIWIFEACVQKGLFICFNFGSPQYCDLMAFTGYKFVVLCLVMLATVFGNAQISYGVMVVFGVMFSYFFYCTLRRFQTAHTLADHAKTHGFNKKTF